MPVIQELKNKTLIISIPKHLAKFKGWKKGIIIDFIEKNGDIVLKVRNQ